MSLRQVNKTKQFIMFCGCYLFIIKNEEINICKEKVKLSLVQEKIKKISKNINVKYNCNFSLKIKIVLNVQTSCRFWVCDHADTSC